MASPFPMGPTATAMFERWVNWVFDCPTSETESRLTGDDTEHPPVAQSLAFMTELFEGAESVLGAFTDAQVNQGLWFLASNAHSQHFYAFTDRSLPEEQRLRGVHSIGTLYKNLFAKRCSPHLSHLNEMGAGDLNPICYMLWDVAPLPRFRDEQAFDAVNLAAIDVMVSCLAIDHDACRESALHGLGENHFHRPWRSRIHSAIDEFLARTPTVRPELADYALQARSGAVQ